MAESMPLIEPPNSSSETLRADAPERPAPAPPDRARWRFTRAYRRVNPTGTPRAIAWFGFRSFWGHLRHFMVSAIATEDVDTRDWMEPTAPPALEAKVARTLGAVPQGTLVDSLGRDVFIDANVLFEGDAGRHPLLEHRDGVPKLYYSFWLERPLDDPADRDAIRAFRAAIARAPRFVRRLERGEMLVIDNRRMLHGRAAIGGLGRHLERFWIAKDDPTKENER